MQSSSPDMYLSMHQFADLKLQARQHSADAKKAVTQQFEGLFVQMMLKQMRAAATVDDSLHSSTMDFYNDMYDKQLSLVLARQGGIGIADLLQQHLGGDAARRQPPTPPAGLDLPQYRLPVARTTQLPIEKMNYQTENPAVKTHPLQAAKSAPDAQSAVSSGAAVSQPLKTETLKPFYGWTNAESFVADVWPHAERAAEHLGVSAHVLVAQSALETGWGQYTMKKPDGSIAFNLFGIKAGSDWQGQSVVQGTLEFRDGAMQRESARFRAYDSIGEALDDYVNFIQGRPRYSEALQHQGSDQHYVRSLQRAGYATDPAYADKILTILRGQTFNDALAMLSVPQRDIA